jgi:hypothetical protein
MIASHEFVPAQSRQPVNASIISFRLATTIVAIFGALAITVATAFGGVAADPVQLGWNGMRGAGGLTDQTFACDTIGGSHRLDLSFTAPDSVLHFVAMDVMLELRSAGERLPPWWEYKNSGSCRTLSLSLDLTHAPPADSGAAILDPWDGGVSGVGLVSGFRRDIDGDPRIAQIAVSMARPISNPVALVDGERYWAGALVIDNRRTLGKYACAGCGDPVTIRVLKLTLFEADGHKIMLEPGPRVCVGWQGATCEASHARTRDAGP